MNIPKLKKIESVKKYHKNIELKDEYSWVDQPNILEVLKDPNKLNPETKAYDLVAELDTWDLDVPVNRFIEKLTQQYARMTIHNSVKEMGFEVAEEWEMDDNSIELTVTRWT